MPSHSEGPGIRLSVWRFLLTHCLYERVAEVLARLRGCAGSPKPSLLAYAISTKFAWRGPNIVDPADPAHLGWHKVKKFWKTVNPWFLCFLMKYRDFSMKLKNRENPKIIYSFILGIFTVSQNQTSKIIAIYSLGNGKKHNDCTGCQANWTTMVQTFLPCKISRDCSLICDLMPLSRCNLHLHPVLHPVSMLYTGSGSG